MNQPFSFDGQPAPEATIEDRKKTLVRDLHCEYELVNQTWEEAIEWLREIPVLDGAEVVWMSYGDDRYDELLSYHKQTGEWTICLGSRDNEDFDEEYDHIKWKPILECSMSEKAEALEGLNQLKEKVLEKGEEFVISCRRLRDPEPF